MEKLYAEKLCPFCGGKPYLERSHRAFINGKSTRVAFVRCTKCNARSDRFKIEDFGHTSHSREAERLAIEAWDTRKPMERIVERLEEERTKLYNARSKLTKRIYINNDAFNRARELQAKELSVYDAIEIVKDGGENEHD